MIEDFGSLAAITASSDALWFSSTYAITKKLNAGLLRELPCSSATEPPQHVGVVMYSLERRSPSPWARSIKQLLRQQIKVLAKSHLDQGL
ncbi:hypothetical protein PX699_18695 [Sphingobium sp. H39-3-25]|uniref:hypothetical protein n=1 Tax=Sphingobium arseniciresistens TaxID=3030834 RepID=UPI0023BA0300|nr:hypothetical protein [Sphingobium arseniciresistens]